MGHMKKNLKDPVLLYYGAYRGRTDDLNNAIVALYQLS